MGAPTLEVGYISASTGRGNHEVHKGHVVALKKTVAKCKAIPLLTWTGPEVFRRLRLPNFKTIGA
jgi:hypothetical protein